jgi:hypothetical protein
MVELFSRRTNMKFIAIAALALMISPAKTELPFYKKYIQEFTKANTALQVYASTSCTDTSFKRVSDQTITAIQSFTDIYNQIPDSESPTLQNEQIEMYLGFLDVVEIIAKDKANCAQQTKPSKPNDTPSVPNDPLNKNS